MIFCLEDNAMRIYKYLSAAILVALAVSFLALPSSAAPDVSAKSAILIEKSSGDAVYEKNAHERLPMASTTKIMTALIAVENCDMDAKYEVPAEATGIEGSSVYLKAGETLTMRELVMCLMLESANDAATAIALLTAGSIEGFAGMMNDKASELGLNDTHFDNPHGLDSAEHYTTAADLAHLTAYALDNADFREIVSTKNATVTLHDGEGVRMLGNHNRLLRSYDGCIGVKTGFTKKSGRCLVSSAERDGVTLIAVTLNAPDDWNDHRAMLDYGFTQYKCVVLAEPGQFSCVLPVAGAADGCEAVAVTNRDGLSVVLRCGVDEIYGASDVSATVETSGLLFAPIDKGDEVGCVIFRKDGKTIGTLPLYAEMTVSAPVKEKTIIEKIKAIFG